MSPLFRYIHREWQRKRRTRTARALGTGVLTFLFSCWFLFAACAHFANRAAVYTEGSIRAAEQVWDEHYNAEADRCESLYEPKTPEMEECFGDTYDANAEVERAIRSAVALLRSYWTARQQHGDPHWPTVQKELAQIFEDLPSEAKQIFDKYAKVERP